MSEPALRLHDNPLLVAQARRRLRRKQLAPALLITGVLGVCAILFGLAGTNGESDWRFVAGMIYFALGAVLLLGATGRVGAAIAEAQATGLIDFHRATPTSAWTDTVGYLLGAPAREYALALAMLPFLVAAVGLGHLPLRVLAGVPIVVLSSLLYGAAALVLGLTRRQHRSLAGGVVVLVMVLLVGGAVSSASHTAVLGFLSPIEALVALLRPVADDAPPIVPTFFAVPVHPALLSALIQSVLLGFLVYGAARKMHREAAPAFSRPGALGFFAVLIFLGIGVAWGVVRGRVVDADVSPDGTAIAAVLVYLVVATIVAGVLLMSTTPSYLEYLRELRRARRHGQSQPSWLADNGDTWPLITPFALLVLGGFVVLAAGLSTRPSLWSLAQPATLLGVFGVVGWLAFSVGATEWALLSLRNAAASGGVLMVFLTLVLPFIASGLAHLAGASDGVVTVVMALCPGFGAVGGFVLMLGRWTGEHAGEPDAFPVAMSIAVAILLSIGCYARTLRIKRALVAQIPLERP